MQLYHAIYLSPHLDDAALSCGGQIYQQTAAGRSVLVVTLMAGDPPAAELSAFARSLHQRWQLAADAVAARRAEDVAACRRLGADFLHWDVPDCVYRRYPHHYPAGDQPLYPSVEAIFGPLHPAEAGLVAELARRLASLPACDRVIVPLTVGHHVDHQLTRAAAEAWPAHPPLAYYEEYPYVQYAGAPENGQQWLPEVIPLSPADLQARLEAIASYQSQLNTFFSSPADLEQQVSDYVQAVGGERLWHRHFPEVANLREVNI